MINMIKLDWLGIKYYWVRIILVPLSICFLGLIFNEALIIPTIACVMLFFSITPFAVEEKGKLDNLYLTLPVIRKTIVNSRFGLSLMLQTGGLVVGTVVTLMLSAMLYGRTFMGIQHAFKADFYTMCLILCASLLSNSIMNLSMFPLLFKIGYSKGKALGFYIPIGVLVVTIYGVILVRELNKSFSIWLVTALDWVINNNMWVAAIMLITAALIFATSYTLSYKAYAKRAV